MKKYFITFFLSMLIVIFYGCTPNYTITFYVDGEIYAIKEVRANDDLLDIPSVPQKEN